MYILKIETYLSLLKTVMQNSYNLQKKLIEEIL